MTGSLSRRDLLAAGALAAVAGRAAVARPTVKNAFEISLAQWSYHKGFFGQKGVEKLEPLQFAAIAKKVHGIAAVEYVNQFYKAKKNDDGFLKDLKKVADDNGVTSVLIMCDGEGNLGDPDDKKRSIAVDNHLRWLEWSKALGCHSIRVNAASTWSKGFEETQKLAADGLRKLSEKAKLFNQNVIVENHGGLSSHGAWLAGVMKMVGLPNCGTLPDFGNFRVGKIGGFDKDEYDRYQGIDELMPFAKGVSAKSHDFDATGNETKTDYRKMMQLVLKKHKYAGFVGIEYEGSKLSEKDGIDATKKLLEAVRKEMA
jgi:sugar phosphate isomerase/epimerase